MFEDVYGKRIVAVEDRYMYRGRATGELGPFIILEEATHVIDHGTDSVKEEIPIGRARVNLERCEAWWEEEGTLWIPETVASPAASKKGKASG